MRPFVVTSRRAGALASMLLTACASPYQPAHPVRLTVTGTSYLKDGQSYRRDWLGHNLIEVVADDPVAVAYARSARSHQLWALGADVVSGVAGIASIPLALKADRHLNDPAVQILLNTSLVLAIVGPLLHVRSTDRELDAVNAYNDRLSTRAAPPSPASHPRLAVSGRLSPSFSAPLEPSPCPPPRACSPPSPWNSTSTSLLPSLALESP